MKHYAEQFELFGSAPKPVSPLRKPITANIRVGKINTRHFGRREVTGLCMPKGDGACDAFDRAMAERYDEDF